MSLLMVIRLVCCMLNRYRQMHIVLMPLFNYNSSMHVLMVAILVVDWCIMGNGVRQILVIDCGMVRVAMVVSKCIVRILPVLFIEHFRVEGSLVYCMGCTMGMERIIIDCVVSIIEVGVRSCVRGC